MCFKQQHRESAKVTHRPVKDMCKSCSSKTRLASRIRTEFLQIIKKKETRFLNQQSLQRAAPTARYTETRLDVRRAVSTLRSGYMTPRMGTQPLGRGPAVDSTRSTPRVGGTPTHRPGAVSSVEASGKAPGWSTHSLPTSPSPLYPGGTASEGQGLPSALATPLSTPSRGLLTGFSHVTHATCLTSCLFLSYEPALVSLNHAAPAGTGVGSGGGRGKSQASPP